LKKTKRKRAEVGEKLTMFSNGVVDQGTVGEERGRWGGGKKEGGGVWGFLHRKLWGIRGFARNDAAGELSY